MSLKEIAKETLAILERGAFEYDGEQFEFRDALDDAIAHTTLYTPGDYDAISLTSAFETTVAVRDETTQDAAKRLCENYDHVALLNFASAKNPGGGFINGAKAQEEDLARCSGLYPCIVQIDEYYAANRRDGTMLYTDHIIFSPRVPFFRTRGRDEASSLFFPSVITAPAPNAGEHLRRHPDDWDGIEDALVRRARYVLSVAADQHVDALILGAWGCGIFRNDPFMVAKTFDDLLHRDFDGVFDHVCFAIYARSKPANLEPFATLIT